MAHYFNYVERIIPKRKPRPLKMGSILHSMLQLVYMGKDWTPVLESVKTEFKKMMDEEKDFYGDLPGESEMIVTGYLKMYRSDKIKYQLIEKTLGPIKLTERTQFNMRIDRLASAPNGYTYLCETKSGRKIPQEEIRIWDLQTVLYVWALRKLGYKVDGILWDYIRTKPPAIPQTLKDGTLTQRKDIDTTFEVYLKAIKDLRADPRDYKDILDSLRGRESQFYRRVILPINDSCIEPILRDAKNTSLEIFHLRDNPVRSVSGFTCPRCFYSSLCYSQLRGLDESFVRKAEYMKREEEIDYAEETEEN